jgi:hypothetical protein
MSTDTANRPHLILALAARALAVLALAGFATAAQAGPNLVTNGTFDNFNSALNTGACANGGSATAANMAQLTNCDLPGWQSSGTAPNNNYSFVLGAPYTQGTNFTTTSGGVLSLYGPAEASGSKIPASPAGSNFLAVDGAYQSAYTYQQVPTVLGTLYTVTFWMSAGQQTGFSCVGDPTGHNTCTNTWQVGLGTSVGTGASVTPTPITLLSTAPGTGQGWVGAGGTNWVEEEVTLMANAANDLLWFFAVGTPGSTQPPFSLLDGVTMSQTVPEPPAYGMLMVGLLGLLGARRAWRMRR